MRLFRFDAAVGRTINQFDSVNAIVTPILQMNGQIQIGSMHMGPHGIVGYHQATTPQLFLVVQGSGWVRAEEETLTPIIAGQGAFWDTAEWHESGTEGFMLAIVIEGEGLDPSIWLTSLD